MGALSAPWLAWPDVQRLAALLADAPLRFVGGCVRDCLLGRPTQEVDAAIPLPPEAVMDRLEAAGIRAIPTGIDHGTITARMDTHAIEITTLRRDVACDGRHAEVVYTDRWEEDAARRDFTINALYADAEGVLYDYVGGQADLAARRLVFIGAPEERIAEDALRILRLFRFLAQMPELEADAASLSACQKEAERMRALSGERIQQEMWKLLRAPALDMQVLAMLPTSPLELPPPPTHLAGVLAAEATHRLIPRAERRLAAWVNAEQLEAVRARWKLSNAAYHTTLSILRTAANITPGIDEAAQKRLIRREGADIFRDAVTISAPESCSEMLALAAQWVPPEFPVSGRDALALGVPAGPALGAALKTLEAWWESEGYQPPRDTLLARLKGLVA